MGSSDATEAAPRFRMGLSQDAPEREKFCAIPAESRFQREIGWKSASGYCLTGCGAR